MKRVVVIGLGNTMMSDDGVGVHLVRELQQCDLSDVEFLDLGVAGLSVLHAIRGRDAAVLIDCARMGEAPGVLRRFEPQEVISAAQRPRFSLHGGDLLEILELGRALGEAAKKTIIIGIEPELVQPGENLSANLRARLPEYVRAVANEVRALQATKA